MTELKEVQEMLTQHRLDWWEEWKNEGLVEGRAEGRTSGLAEGRTSGIADGILLGEARVLRQQLARRFGSLPDWVETKLAAASEESLLKWGESVVDAPSLEELFGR